MIGGVAASTGRLHDESAATSDPQGEPAGLSRLALVGSTYARQHLPMVTVRVDSLDHRQRRAIGWEHDQPSSSCRT